MNPERYHQVNSILEEVIDLRSDAQERIIQERCDGDQTLESAVRRMIETDKQYSDNHVMGDHVIDSARAELEAILNDPHLIAPSLPDRIAEYRIIREIGRGGMGVVYECEQQHPKRRVAIKVVESFLRASALNKRLVAESQIQGQLQHPVIARVYDAGFTRFGQAQCPYFVMELINGSPLHVYASDHALTHHAKIQLIAKVCEGMKHAHERGIIHRDLKPENILVQPDAQPKVLDFGIARFINDTTLAATTMTSEGQVLGTLAYMAPEQLSGKSDQTSARSDVFSLGAIIYQLLVGHPPFQLEGMSLSSAFRAIELDDPIKIRQINRSIDPDLQTIIMRCLSKEPQRRFANAGELGDELIRYLTNQPIKSHPPSRWYRSRKFISRNKIFVSGVSATIIALLIGLLFTIYFASGQRSARILAQQQELNARSNEINAIRGVIGGVIPLAEQGQTWDSVKQLNTIAPESRGWEWDHIALSLPWVTSRQSMRRSSLRDDSALSMIGFVDNDTVAECAPKTNQIWITDVIHNTRSILPLSSDEISNIEFHPVITEHSICVRLKDSSVVSVDLRSGEMTELYGGKPVGSIEQHGKLKRVSADRRLLTLQNLSVISIFEEGRLVYQHDTGYTKQPQMNWNDPIFDPLNHSVYLASWNNEGEVIAVDTRTWTVRHSVSTNSIGPYLQLSPDATTLYCNSIDSGVQMFSTKDLKIIDNIDPDRGLTTMVVLSPDGNTIAASFYDHHELRMYDTRTLQLIGKSPMGADHLIYAAISPDSSILLANSPTNYWNWLIDLDESPDSSITKLHGHGSWVYQLAISPDGSLLASAEPEGGDVLLWDLNRNRLLARFSREIIQSKLAFYMNSPLIFDPSGTSLYFGQHSKNTDQYGLTKIDLQSGHRSWTQTGTLDQTIDAAADIIGFGQIHHHAAVLNDGRILQSNASIANTNNLRVRGRVGADMQSIQFENEQNTTGGVAVHPSGEVYATGQYLMTRIYDAQTDQLLFEIADGYESKVYGMNYSPDGKRLAVGLEDGTILLFDTEFYKLLAKIKVPPASESSSRNYIYSLVWTPDSKRLVTAGGSFIRILESQRLAIRERAQSNWESRLQTARREYATDSSIDECMLSAVQRIVRIESWSADHLINERPPHQDP